jgi:CubicO group peptidase (beta-lactamase class C family)
MNQTRRSVLGLLGSAPLLLSAAGTGSPATAATAAGVPEDLRPGGALDRLIADLAARDAFAGTVLLTHRGRTVLARSHGMADRSRSVPNGPNTLFALGSITKMFTGVAIGQLVERGAVAYHEKLGHYLNGFAADVAEVTVHQLLTHTSGLGDYMRDEAYWAEALEWTSVEETWERSMTYVRRDRLTFPPGTAYQYSNTAYHALGAVVAEVSGVSYYDYVRQHVLRAAGMSTADFYVVPHWREDRRIAHPYPRGQDGERTDGLDEHIFVGSPAGGAHANAPELVRFMRAMLDGTLLDPAYTALVLSPKTPRPPMQPPPGKPRLVPFTTYAAAANLVEGQWILGHNGGAPGVSTNVDTYPASGWTAVVLSNYDQATREIDGMIRQLVTSAG